MLLSNFLDRRNPYQIVVIGLLLTFVIGYLDIQTGFEFSFSIFYLIPVSFVTWYARRNHGFFIAVICAFTWYYSDFKSGHQYSMDIIPKWNAFVRFGYFIITAFLISKYKNTLDQVTRMAKFDSLTQIFNVRGFSEVLEKELQLAVRYKHPIAIGYIDVDNFKTVNDTIGHAEGDRVLQTVGKVLSKTIRVTDIAGRLGGDEFAIILLQQDIGGAKTVFNKIHAVLIETAQAEKWPIGFSVGVVVYNNPPLSVDEVLGQADGLMYGVKKSGKNFIQFKEINREV